MTNVRHECGETDINDLSASGWTAFQSFDLGLPSPQYALHTWQGLCGCPEFHLQSFICHLDVTSRSKAATELIVFDFGTPKADKSEPKGQNC